jgi:hypothetical protein
MRLSSRMCGGPAAVMSSRMRCQVDSGWGSEECTLLWETGARVRTRVIAPNSAGNRMSENCRLKNAVVRAECTQDGSDAILEMGVDRGGHSGGPLSILVRTLRRRCEGQRPAVNTRDHENACFTTLVPAPLRARHPNTTRALSGTTRFILVSYMSTSSSVRVFSSSGPLPALTTASPVATLELVTGTTYLHETNKTAGSVSDSVGFYTSTSCRMP